MKKARLARGLTQQQLADRLGVCVRTMKRWEKSGPPHKGVAHNFDNILKLIKGSRRDRRKI